MRLLAMVSQLDMGAPKGSDAASGRGAPATSTSSVPSTHAAKAPPSSTQLDPVRSSTAAAAVPVKSLGNGSSTRRSWLEISAGTRLS